MKPIFFSLIFFLSIDVAYSQGGIWTWISGATTLGASGVYGTQGIPSSNNHPPGLYEPAEWKDKQGNFWIYGGMSPFYSDLWKYNLYNNEWTWIKGNGSSFQTPVYGIQGVSNINNTPGSRYFASATWVDTSGNLWLFGGNSYRNDLWEYEISSNEWTWIKGDTIFYGLGNHGTQGIPGPTIQPGARDETCSAWIDSLNNLWLFGGYGLDDNGNQGYLNDLMKFNISTNEWTWMKGSSFINATSNYGSLGVSNPGNDPGARASYQKWKDAQGNFWLFAGTHHQDFNDIWKYDISNNIWTWMNGSNIVSDTGLYIGICTINSQNLPSSRHEQRSGATDNCGMFWLYGGLAWSRGVLNDLWLFNPQQLEWSLLSGGNIPNQNGSYGSLGVPLPTNLPPARMGAVAWWGDDNRFYLFGGTSGNTDSAFSDLWVFTPDSTCIRSCNSVRALSSFQGSNRTFCSGTCINFNNYSINSTIYQWFFPGATPDTSTATNPTNICYPNSGTYDVTLIASNANGSDTLTLQNYITVFPQPPPQSISQSGDTLFAIAGSSSYQWYFNGNIISGATDYFYLATASGDYNVVATDSNGCEVEAVINDVLVHTILAVGYWPVEVYPNPVTSTLYIRGLKNNSADEIKIFNVFGEKVFSAVNCSPSRIRPSADQLQISNCQLFPAGFYCIEITSDKNIYRTKFVKQ